VVAAEVPSLSATPVEKDAVADLRSRLPAEKDAVADRRGNIWI
jgi:hypothetical protein